MEEEIHNLINVCVEMLCSTHNLRSASQDHNIISLHTHFSGKKLRDTMPRVRGDIDK